MLEATAERHDGSTSIMGYIGKAHTPFFVCDAGVARAVRKSGYLQHFVVQTFNLSSHIKPTTEQCWLCFSSRACQSLQPDWSRSLQQGLPRSEGGKRGLRQPWAETEFRSLWSGQHRPALGQDHLRETQSQVQPTKTDSPTSEAGIFVSLEQNHIELWDVYFHWRWKLPIALS